jgi:hypothetical protein
MALFLGDIIMRQTTLSVALEVKPESYEHLSSLLDELHDKRSTDPFGAVGPFAEFITRVPVLHFMSLSLFPGYDYDPLFVIEANFDGAPGPFWAQLEAAIGDDLRKFLRCCKRPLDFSGPLFDAVTAPDSRAPIAPYLEAHALTPTAFHHGNRGMTCDRIREEFKLFRATRDKLAVEDADYRRLEPVKFHKKLRAALVDNFPWLNRPAPPRIAVWEDIGDRLKLATFIVAAIFALSLPGLALTLFMPSLRYFVLALILFVVLAAWLKRIADPLPGTATPTRFDLPKFLFAQLPPIVMFLAIYCAVASLIGAPFSMLLTGRDFVEAWSDMVVWLALGLLSLPATIAGILVWLRSLERADCSQNVPHVDPKLLRAMAQREDWIPQNHMGSIVLIKPGVLRAMLIRAGHLGLGLLLRVTARDGYLGSMRTIHFAHWAMVNNKTRLMFFSNFDQTWESYLDDFVEKAHVGLTLAWSCGVGFPPARFLLYEGASQGRQFKEWARHSMAVSHFWHSAYKDLTTEQIERNYRIALGLRQTNLSDEEAAQWISDL